MVSTRVNSSDAQTWVLLRGWGRAAGHWLDFPEVFRDAHSAREVHCLDLPGLGADSRGQSPLTIPEIRKSMQREMNKQGLVKRPFYLLGISLGGMVAIDWALNSPDELQGLVIINSSLASESRFFERLKPQNYRSLLRIGRERELIKKEEQILSMLSNFPGVQKDIGKRWARVSSEHPPRMTNLLFQLLAAATYYPPPIELKIPGLVLVSEGDRFVDPKCSYRISERYHLPLRQHPWGGHELALDDPEWIVTTVEDWLQSIKG